MLLIIKIISLFLILGLSSLIGIMIASKYNMRVKELEDLISALELLDTRVKYTYDTIADSFDFVGETMKTKAYRIFMICASQLNESKGLSAGDVFRNTVDSECIFLSLSKDDIEILKGLGTSLRSNGFRRSIKEHFISKKDVRNSITRSKK